MSFIITYKTKKVIVTFTKIVEEHEVKNAFIEIVDTIRIKDAKLFIFDFTTIESYVIPKDYMKILKTITKFSSTWNKDIKVVVIATHTDIKNALTSIIKQQEEHYWEYHLYENIETARKFNSEI